jgi:hypothetical protein
MTRTQLPDAGFFVLPRRWSLAVLWTLASLLALGGVTAGVTHARIGHIEKAVETYKGDHDDVVTLKEAVRGQSEILKRIEHKLDRARP